jgi:replicative DNA helicase
MAKMVLDTAGAVSCQEMTPTTNTPGPRLYRLGDLLQDFQEEATAAHAAKVSGHARGPISRFLALDDAIGGAFAPGLHMLHGGPGTGKTALALQIAATCGFPALFVSCEMAPLELLRRLIARATSTYLGRLKTGEFHPVEAVMLARKACEAAPGLAIVDGTAGYPSPEWLQQRAEEVRGDARQCLLVVDSLHSWAHGSGGEASEYDALNAALLNIGKLAASLQCPAIVITERNRSNMQRGGLHAGAGSRRIEYAGETVIGLDRETDPDTVGEVRVRVTIEKNRHGVTGVSLPLLFHGALQRFREGA